MKNFRSVFSIIIIIIVCLVSTIVIIISNNNHTKLKKQIEVEYKKKTQILKDEYKTLENKHKVQIKDINKQFSKQSAQETVKLEIIKKDLLKTQEKLSKSLTANTTNKEQQIKTFMSERKNDILFLSRIKLRQKLITSFYHTKKLDDSSLYKEVSYFNLNGKEIYKKSSIEVAMQNVSRKKNTYCQKEIYFNKLGEAREGEVFASSKIDCKNKKPIIRLITPIVRKFKKVGYLSVALDYQHIENINKKFIKNTKE